MCFDQCSRLADEITLFFHVLFQHDSNNVFSTSLMHRYISFQKVKKKLTEKIFVFHTEIMLRNYGSTNWCDTSNKTHRIHAIESIRYNIVT